jgi:hypothetical protein
MKHAAIIVASHDLGRVEEALRAALGLTLRGATVQVWLAPSLALTPAAQRAVAVLRSFGHAVDPWPDQPPASPPAARLAAMDVVEVWT